MGCDIHMYCEYKHKHGQEKPKWVSADHYRVNPHYGVYEDESQWEVIHLYDDRWYRLFGILAGVRDYEVKPIAEQRGIPSDCCKEIKKECDDYGCDGHSHSYLTLKELMDNRSKYIGKEDGYDVLGVIIDPLIQRTKEVFHIYGYQNQDDVNEIIAKSANDIRIVFWFDN